MSLDPGDGLQWGDVVDAARNVRQRLADLGLESYVKTSGGKGLHVVSPLKPSVDWDELKAFAHGIAVAMERDEPSKYVSTMAKKARGGKIFSTTAKRARRDRRCGLFVAGRPGATISTPVTWDKLGPAVTPTRFTVENIGRRLAALKPDPWDGYFRRPQNIRDVIGTSKASLAAARRTRPKAR